MLTSGWMSWNWLCGPTSSIPFPDTGDGAFCISLALGKHLSWSWFFTWCGDPNLHPSRVLGHNHPAGVGCCHFLLTLITGHPKVSLVFQTHSPLPSLWNSRPFLLVVRIVHHSQHRNSLLCLLTQRCEDRKCLGSSLNFQFDRIVVYVLVEAFLLLELGHLGQKRIRWWE